MQDEAAATAAMEALRGKDLNGRIMDVVLDTGPKGGNRRRR
jgi:hypothetical protein